MVEQTLPFKVLKDRIIGCIRLFEKALNTKSEDDIINKDGAIELGANLTIRGEEHLDKSIKLIVSKGTVDHILTTVPVWVALKGDELRNG